MEVRPPVVDVEAPVARAVLAVGVHVAHKVGRTQKVACKTCDMILAWVFRPILPFLIGCSYQKFETLADGAWDFPGYIWHKTQKPSNFQNLKIRPALSLR